MERLESPAAERGAVASVTLPARNVGPAAVLARGVGDARGFWARGDRWVAHLGAVCEVTVAAGDDAADDRFRDVWRRAAPLLRSVAEGAEADDTARSGGVEPARPRFYGGFAFRSDPAASGDVWRGFPAARFVLPAVEVAGRGEEARITVRALRDDVGGGEEALRQRAARLVEELLTAPRRVADDGSRRAGEREAASVPSPRASVGRVEADRSRWRAAVEEARRWIEGERASKVVLARTLDVVPTDEVDAAPVALHLWRQNPGTHVFLLEPSEGGALVGAAPETVATVADGRLGATAVAGSISRGDAPEEQEALALQLLESGKDRAEHAFAVEDIVHRLRPLTRELTWDSEPHVLTLSRIQHLETRIQARLADGESALSVVAALHPTPAVCGLPREAALDFLRVEEPFERGWYAGPVGWFDAAGDGVFAPALRSGVWTGQRWRLFAGAGIVAASDPDREWEETRIKFEPMLRALEAAGADGGGSAPG